MTLQNSDKDKKSSAHLQMLDLRLYWEHFSTMDSSFKKAPNDYKPANAIGETTPTLTFRKISFDVLGAVLSFVP